jgi:acetyl esterase/lipase
MTPVEPLKLPVTNAYEVLLFRVLSFGVLALWLAGSLALAQGADPRGAIVESRFVQSYSPADIERVGARLYSRASPPAARYGVDQYLVTYLSTDEYGAPAEVIAQLYIPRLSSPAELPVYVMGAGTTGVGPQCAASKELPSVRNWGDYRAHMLSYASQGYIGILPDYQGFHGPGGVHYYFVADLESRMMLDAARAVYRIFENSPLMAAPSNDVFLAGYSQGGHAVFAATDIAPTYAPELAIRGAIGYAPSTDVEALMRDIPYLTPYILYAYAQFYGAGTVNIASKLNPRWLANLEQDVMNQCVDEIAPYYGLDARAVYNEEFYNALYGGHLAESFPELKALLDINSTGRLRSDVPALIIQGAADPIVSTTSQDAFVARQCGMGAHLAYRVYPDVHHFHTRQFAFRDTVAWMQTITAGRTPPSDCGRILSQAP